MSGAVEEQRVGLLFVHGIGEQKRFEFLRSSVVELAELMRQSGGPGEKLAASVVDRTMDWKPDPGEPHPQGLSPMTLTVEGRTRHLTFECHEVWWADLGARAGLMDSLVFWFWGFGQWLAPIYRDLDAAGLEKVDRGTDGRPWNKPASKLVKLPEAVAGRFGPECLARARLAAAALATLLSVVSWVVLKRLFATLLGKAPSPTLLVSYVGDVRLYEERAVPGGGAPGDPGQPRRVGIRRRMVAEVVRMGARTDLDRWYVVAHSQGTVLAYNALTEIGHALPNYLSQDQWAALPPELKRDPGCEPRPAGEIPDMMPARPPWLTDVDVLNRPALFVRLRGLLTYGSPLNKFAAIWPRIVATATDRRSGARPPFADECLWVNLRALQDPIAGDVTRFFGPKAGKPGFEGCLPSMVNVDAPFRPNFLLAHIRYFDVAERFAKRLAITQRRAMMEWIMAPAAAVANAGIAAVEQPRGRLRLAGAAALYLVLLFTIAVFAVCVITLGGDLAQALFGEVSPALADPAVFAKRALANVVPLLAAATTVLALAGHGRWIQESLLNLRLASFDRLPHAANLLKRQLAGSLATTPLAAAASWWLALRWPPVAGLRWDSQLLCSSSALIAIGVIVQALVNLTGKPLRYLASGGQIEPPPAARATDG